MTWLSRRSFRSIAPPQLISEMLKAGQDVVIQIAKEPLGKKGARITSHVALPGRFLVYMPTVHHTGVSRKIISAENVRAFAVWSARPATAIPADSSCAPPRRRYR